MIVKLTIIGDIRVGIGLLLLFQHGQCPTIDDYILSGNHQIHYEKHAHDHFYIRFTEY